MSAATDIVLKLPARKVKAVAAIAAPAIVLTMDESALLSCFRKMDGEHKNSFLSISSVWAPPMSAPALRLIIGGAA